MIYSVPYLLYYSFLLYLYYLQQKKKNFQRQVSAPKNYEALALISYILFFGLRGYVFTDCFQYHEFYEKVGSFSSVMEASELSLYEPGYVLANFFLYYICDEPFFFQFIWTFIDVILLYVILKRETGKYFLLAFAFLIPFFEGVQMNLFRNIKAILIFFWAIKYIREKQMIKYLLAILLAMTFHLTAVLYIPFYFFVNKHIPKTMLVISCVAVAFYFIGLSSLFSDMVYIGVLMGGKFDRITNSYIDSAESVGFTFGFIYRLFLLIYFLCLYKKLSNKNQVMLNVAIIYICCNMFFNDVRVMRDRFAALFALSLPCIIPYVSPSINVQKQKRNFIILNMLFTFAYTYVQNSSIPAKYENLLFGISDRSKAQIIIFNSL